MWCVCVYGCVPVRVYLCDAWVCVCVCTSVYEYIFYVYGCVVQRYGPIWWDSDPLQEIRICTRYAPDTLAIQRLIHGMTRRSVPVRAMKTRRQFRFKTTLFHVSVCSCVISLFTVVSRHIYVTRIISCDRLIYFTSVIMRITSWVISERSTYLFYWNDHLSSSFHV